MDRDARLDRAGSGIDRGGRAGEARARRAYPFTAGRKTSSKARFGRLWTSAIGTSESSTSLLPLTAAEGPDRATGALRGLDVDPSALRAALPVGPKRLDAILNAPNTATGKGRAPLLIWCPQ